MAFDDLLLTLGEFGRYQKIAFAVLWFCWFPGASNVLSVVFLADEADHWCAVPTWTNANCSGINTYGLDCGEYVKYLTIPSNKTEGGKLAYSKCDMYDVSSLSFEERARMDQSEDPQLDFAFDVIPCDNGWVHDRDQAQYTIIQEFDLVCSRKHFLSMSQSIFFVGVLFGSLVFGDLADRFGRKTILVVSNIIVVAFGVAVAFAKSFLAFIVLRAFLAAGCWGLLIISNVLALEFVGPSRRAFVGIFISVSFSGGYLLLTLYAYFLRNWRLLQLVLNLTFALWLILLLLFPESPRWQISKGHFEKARKTIRRMAQVNKVEIPDGFLDRVEDSDESMAKDMQERGKTFDLTDLFRTPVIRKRTLVLIIVWMTNNLIYYGLHLSTGSFGVNIYLSFLISGVVETVAVVACVFAIDWVGRKATLIGSFAVAGVASLIIIFFAPGAAKTALAMVGKFGIAATWCVGGLYILEVLPTSIRNVGIGVCSMSSRVVAVATPLILMLAELWRPAPLVIQTAMALVTATLCLILPETRGEKLPETVEDGENLGRNQNLWPLSMTFRSRKERSNCDKRDTATWHKSTSSV